MISSVLLVAAGAISVLAKPTHHEYDDSLHHFKSRPDIKAPKYELEVYNESAVSPGYWMVGPYETLNMADEVLDGWIGPAIYDGAGELIYSGAPVFENSNTEDFRLSNVNGEEMFALMDQSHWKAVLMDKHYNIKKRLKVGGPGTFNSHEFHFIENGTRALVVYNQHEYRSEEESARVGYPGKCYVGCNGLAEFDTRSWQTTFEWSSCGHIDLSESTDDKGNVSRHCEEKHGWDYVHGNSIDKTPEGDYLYSGRHCDAIFKISGATGNILWRLGGKLNDFEMVDGLNFTRQHNIRYVESNATHTVVSMLDNALGEDFQGPSYNMSRGLYLALDEENMRAAIVTQFDHPMGGKHWNNRRGSLQTLPNGNVLMGWSERGRISEHLPNGTMVMNAFFTPRWLGTYRSYKFAYTGWPGRRPDAAAEAVDVNYGGGTQTVMYASQNGATEIASWKFYKTNPLGQYEIDLGSAERTGFETNFTYGGFAKYVVAEALHANGTVLGRSRPAATKFADDSTDAVQEEEEWQATVTPLWWKILHSAWFYGSASIVIAIAIGIAIRRGCRKLSAARAWRRLRRLSASRSRRPFRLATWKAERARKVQDVEDFTSADSSAPLIERARNAWELRSSSDVEGEGEEKGRFRGERF